MVKPSTLVRAERRITSYNVCYTKLLRIFITGVSTGFGRSLAAHALSEGHRVVGTLRKADACAAFEAVITSYSIHYTKLYEGKRGANCPRLRGLSSPEKQKTAVSCGFRDGGRDRD